MTEAEFEGCVQRICAGDKSGLKDIYEAYFPYLYSVIYGIVQNKENAEDVTSDFFIKLWTTAESYKPGNGHKGYLATIARNMAIDFIRKRKREVLTESFEQPSYGEDGNDQSMVAVSSEGQVGSNILQTDSNTPEKEVISNISLREALDRLKPEEREIINWKVLGEMTFQEIADLTGAPMGTVTWRYREAIKKLRRCGYE